jgi:hypothetical protein
MRSMTLIGQTEIELMDTIPLNISFGAVHRTWPTTTAWVLGGCDADEIILTGLVVLILRKRWQ